MKFIIWTPYVTDIQTILDKGMISFEIESMYKIQELLLSLFACRNLSDIT